MRSAIYSCTDYCDKFVLIPMSDQSLTITLRNLAMDFGYKLQGDMDIVRGFMAKIGDKGQAFVNQ